jgi:hypothetical protein
MSVFCAAWRNNNEPTNWNNNVGVRCLVQYSSKPDKSGNYNELEAKECI